MTGWGRRRHRHRHPCRCRCCRCCRPASSDVPCPCPWRARHRAGRGSRDRSLVRGANHPGRMQRRRDERERPDVCLLQLVLLVSPARSVRINARTAFRTRRRGFRALPLLHVRRCRARITLALDFGTRSLARWLRGFLLGRGRGTMSRKRGSRRRARRRGSTRSGSARLSWARTKGDIQFRNRANPRRRGEGRCRTRGRRVMGSSGGRKGS